MRRIEAQLIHDMRNVATVIRGAAETLHTAQDSLPAGTVDHLTGMLARRSEMLVRLLEDLATVHALDRGDLAIQLQTVSLAETLCDLVAEHRDGIAGELTVDIAPDAVVLADPVRILQILDNLLSNAAKYGGPNVTVRGWREHGLIRISVTDDGPGVPAELVDSLFDLYSRGSASRLVGGSGLGLAIVQQLCSVLGGSISYDGSTGATFVATLPAVPVLGARLGADSVARAGHSVSFWVEDAALADAVAGYVAAGFVSGGAVVIAVTAEHRRMIDERLAAYGFDVARAQALGQYVPLDADELTGALRVDGHVDPERFTTIIGGAIEAIDRRWQTFRVFGEIVDRYWRAGDEHLAVELEACWNGLRARVPFPLYCGYELAADQDRVCDCHDEILVA